MELGILVVVALGAFFLWMQKERKSLQKQMQETFQSLSFLVLERSSKTFLDLASTHLEKYQSGAKSDLEARQKAIEESLTPIKESMKKLDEHQRELEKRREGAYASVTKQLELLVHSEKELRLQTQQLSQALRSPGVRGSWGQVHLRRVVELAGLLNHCDFSEQYTMEADGKLQRPDLVVHLPGQRQIVIDAKTPLDAYLEAAETPSDPIRKKKLQDHSSTLRKHMKDLANKEYWKQFAPSPEYVILFLPAEAFFSAALEADPTLIEIGAEQNIIVATPTTLIAILRAVAHGWKQESLSKSAKEIAKLGQELYERVGTVCEYWNKVGRSLNSAVETYNQSLASFESRVLVSARKLKESGAAAFNKELPEVMEIDKLARSFRVPELANEEKE
ncbi:MAG: DNA recombination protein RmuC [Verrucomicrobia bacterium]|nr:DNA recombination protein RmuC [Verrucomicrobiota bacterium]